MTMTVPIPLTWSRRHKCLRCRRVRECYAAQDGLRCKPCLPRDWTPPDATSWLATFGRTIRVE